MNPSFFRSYQTPTMSLADYLRDGRANIRAAAFRPLKEFVRLSVATQIQKAAECAISVMVMEILYDT